MQHSGREDYPENHGGPRFPHSWFIAEGDELRCSDFAVFPYLLRDQIKNHFLKTCPKSGVKWNFMAQLCAHIGVGTWTT